MTSLHTGSCFCGAVQVEATGDPLAMGYCHCESCRSWSGSPVHASTMWLTDAVTYTSGSQYVATFHKTPESISHRQFCTQCGGHLMIQHPTLGMIDVLAATLQTLTFTPAFHVHYVETVHPMDDDLPKFRDLPTDAGGTGEMV